MMWPRSKRAFIVRFSDTRRRRPQAIGLQSAPQ
jgi:hypothetical protein